KHLGGTRDILHLPSAPISAARLDYRQRSVKTISAPARSGGLGCNRPASPNRSCGCLSAVGSGVPEIFRSQLDRTAVRRAVRSVVPSFGISGKFGARAHTFTRDECLQGSKPVVV